MNAVSSGTNYTSVDTSQIIAEINSGQVEQAQVTTGSSQSVQVTLKNGKNEVATYLNDIQGASIAQALNGHVPPKGYNVVESKQPWYLSVLVTLLPFALLVILFLFLMNQMGAGGGSRVMNFGKSRAKMITKDTPKTTFADVAGVDEAIEELQEIKDFLESPAK